MSDPHWEDNGLPSDGRNNYLRTYEHRKNSRNAERAI